MDWNKLPWHKAKKRWITMVLEEEFTWVPNHNVYTLPKGTVIKFRETTNFGWIHIPEGTKDIHGTVIPYHFMKI